MFYSALMYPYIHLCSTFIYPYLLCSPLMYPYTYVLPSYTLTYYDLPYTHTPMFYLYIPLPTMLSLYIRLHLLFYMVYFREQGTYMKDKYNVLDWLGMLLILGMVPLRAINHDSQWSIASIGYLINCFRIFKFSCITK
jgi:hypothetical protein